VNYFLLNTENGEVKIGYSRKPPRRMYALGLELQRQAKPWRRAKEAEALKRTRKIACIFGDMAQERKLHKLFEQYRVHGEWFRMDALTLIIFWIFEWCERSIRDGELSGLAPSSPAYQARNSAYAQLWEWMACGVALTDGLVRLRGQIVWQGVRWENGASIPDISGARFSVEQAALQQFAKDLVSRQVKL
jgi:hypothetical protein